MFHSRIDAIRNLFLATTFLILIGCSDAPLIIGSVIEPGSIKEGQRVVKVKGLLRKGKYCTDISFADPNAELTWQSADIKLYKPIYPVSAKYKIEIPDIGLVDETDLGEYSKSNFTAAYNEREFYHAFNLDVESITSYRAEVFVTAIFSGPEEVLETYSFKITISEWSCK